MKPRPLHAVRRSIPARFITVAEIDPAKVDRLVQHLRTGGTIPPVVVALYGDDAMPLDGHHRLSACAIIGREVDAWTVLGRSFDALDIRCRDLDVGRAEDFVLCDGVPAMQVAVNSGHHEPHA